MMRTSRAGWIALALVALAALFAATGTRLAGPRVGADRPAVGDGVPPAPPAAIQQASVSPQRRLHILEGDGTGGGHRPGRGIPGKSEFPRGWSDDRIIAAILEVASDPASFRRTEADGRTVVTGTRDGVEIRVVMDRDGRSVVTGYPLNRPRNLRG
jgi:hypothetical protein